MGILAELKRHQVFKVATVYAVVGWLLVQVASVLFETFAAPAWVMQAFVTLVILGFPIAVVLAWAFELSAGRVRRTRAAATGEPVASKSSIAGYVFTAILAGAVGAGSFWLLSRDDDAIWFEEVAIPAIENHIAVGDWTAAFTIAEEAQTRLGANPVLDEIWPRLSWITSIDSEPRGATVFLRAYDADETEWRELGRTPLEGIRIPLGLSRLRLELDGYLPLFRSLGGGLPSRELGPAVNAPIKAFVDAGGYERADLWDPIIRDGQIVPWQDAMHLFTDRTGRLGPSTWEAGGFPLGQEDLPVSGVSWYEAMAYARYLGQELPTAFHWRRARAQGAVPWLMAVSNLASKGPRAITESKAMSFVGAYDLAGNVREWTASPAGDDRIIAGGSWDDEPYVAFQALTSNAPPLDRSAANGFRLAIIRDANDVRERSFTSISLNQLPPDRRPVSDETYAAYGSFFVYDRSPLNASIEAERETRLWRRQRITFDSPYNDDREVLYLYLPSTGSPPFQTVVYWPSGGAYLIDSIDQDTLAVDFVLQSGRAVAVPVFSGIYERRNDRGPPFAPGSAITYRDNVVEGVIDLRRSLDYLETRSDIDTDAFAYFG